MTEAITLMVFVALAVLIAGWAFIALRSASRKAEEKIKRELNQDDPDSEIESDA